RLRRGPSGARDGDRSHADARPRRVRPRHAAALLRRPARVRGRDGSARLCRHGAEEAPAPGGGRERSRGPGASRVAGRGADGGELPRRGIACRATANAGGFGAGGRTRSEWAVSGSRSANQPATATAGGTRQSPLPARFRDERPQPFERGVEDGFARAEREAGVMDEARGAADAALARVHVEEGAGDGDDFALEGGAEEAVARVEGRGKVLQISPDVEGAFGLTLDANAEGAEAIEELVALLAEGAANGFRLGQGVLGREERERGALHRAGAAAVEEGARAGEGLDDAARPDGPGDAPARVAPVLGEAVEEHDRIALDVLDELGRARDGRSVSIQIVGIKLVEQERAVELPRGAHPGLELRADDGLAGGIAGVREQQRAEAAPG